MTWSGEFPSPAFDRTSRLKDLFGEDWGAVQHVLRCDLALADGLHTLGVDPFQQKGDTGMVKFLGPLTILLGLCTVDCSANGVPPEPSPDSQ